MESRVYTEIGYDIFELHKPNVYLSMWKEWLNKSFEDKEIVIANEWFDKKNFKHYTFNDVRQTWAEE